MDCGSNSYKLFLDGDDVGMEEIITEYRDGLIFYLYKLVGSLDKAEELAEDTFVLLCVKKPRDKRKSSFKTWLYTIGRNIAIDYLRRESKHKTLSLESSNISMCSQENLEEEYIQDHEKIIINRALKKLKVEYRQVLWLHYFEDLPYKEISKILHKSVHATHMLASRAKESLKAELIKEGIPNEIY